VNISKGRLYALFACLGIAGAALIAGSLDFGGDAVRRGAAAAVRTSLGADLAIGKIRGNPFRGYVLETVDLKMKGTTFASAAALTVRPALAPILSGRVVVDSVILERGRIDGDRAFPIFAGLGGAGGSGPLPVRSVRLRDVRIASSRFATDLSDVTVSLGENDVGVDGAATVRGVSVSLRSRITMPSKDGAVSIESLSAKIGGGSLDASGAVLPSLGLKGTLSDLDIASLARLWPDMKPDGFDGRLSGSVEARGVWNDPVFSGTLAYAGSLLSGYPVQSAEGHWAFSKMSLSIDGMKVRALGIPMRGSGRMSFGKGVPSLALDLTGGPVPAAEIAKAFPKIPAMTGTMERVSVSVQGTTAAPGGTVGLRASELGAFGRKMRDVAVDVKFAKDGSAAISGKAEFEGAPVTAKGTLRVNAPKPKIDLALTCRSLNAEVIRSFLPAGWGTLAGVLNGDLRFSGGLDAPKISGAIWSDRLATEGEAVETPGVSFAWDGNALSLGTVKGRWRGADIGGSGTVGNLKGTPTLDLNISASVGAGFVTSFFPDFPSWGGQGTANVTVKIAGTTQKPRLSVTARSKSLSAKGIAFGGVSASTGFELPMTSKGIGIPGRDVPLAIELSAESAAQLKNLSLSVKKEKETVTISTLHARSGEGLIEGGGTVTLPGVAGGEPEMKLSFRLAGADLHPLAQSGGIALPVSGRVDGAVSVSGKLSKPEVTAALKSQKIAAAGFAAENADVSVSGNPSLVTIEKFAAEAGGGRLEGKGTFVPGAVPSGTISLSGKKLDAAVLLAALSKELKPSGTLDVSFTGRFRGIEGNGDGTISSQSVTLYGIPVSGVSIPLRLSGAILETKGARAEIAGGKVAADGTFDLRTLRFSKKLFASGVDLGEVVQAFRGSGEKKRMLSGRGNLDLALTGIVDGRKMSLSGRGELAAGEGLVEGIPLAGLLSPLTGQPGIRFASVKAPFVVESDRIRLLQGSRVVAPENDPIYRKLDAEGAVTFAGKLDLKCVASANVALLSAVIGGGVAAGTAGNVSEMISGVLGSVKSGLGERDYRDVSFRVGGKVDAPTASDFSVAGAKQEIQSPTPGAAPQAAKATPTPPPAKSPEEKLLNTLLDVVAPKKK
jgi:hypothetical protein